MDNQNETVLTCATTIEWVNKQAIVVRKVNLKLASLRLIRNEIRQLYIEISADKTAPIKLNLRGINVHKKYMTEGKASIKFMQDQCTLYLSNAPPGTLVTFLKTLFIKMTSDKEKTGNLTEKDVQKKLRAHFLSEKPSAFEDISPVTNNELMRAKKLALSQSTLTTPSPPQAKKRRMGDMRDIKGPAPKKLYSGIVEEEKKAPVKVTEKLNEEQQEVLQACLRGKNIFFTGSAGTGKSFLLRKIIATFPPDGTMATASTGVAACLIGGVTLHSFAGIGSGEGGLQRCYDLASRGSTATAWRKCKRLIIDEISMVDGEYFEKIEAVARYIRKNDKPFGGIQLILCGDFLQLPPVIKHDATSMSQGSMKNKRFCFQSPAWEKCMDLSFELKQVHRQKDNEFVRILNSIRIGRVTPEISAALLKTGGQKIETDGILATQLCSHTNDADLINQSKLSNLEAPEKIFNAQDSDQSYTRQLDQQVPAPGKLTLKIGAQVMLLKNINISEGLVNGARGVVTKYVDGLPLVKFKNNREYLAKSEKWTIKTPSGMLIARKQVPLKLAWAFSIHKSQGLTLDCVEMSLSKVFEAGQAYVALSRAQSLDSLRVLDFDAKQVWANPDVLKYYQQFRRQLYNITYIPLGNKENKSSNNGMKRAMSGTKLTKSLMNKPLVTIS
uniref:ATP-dependent DNA helicase PIF1 n=2 Tax=Culicoides sonorensis TaxID=179676 RepID=A0A336MPL2_CULSO